jgi:CheY-like chemotaxis protein
MDYIVYRMKNHVIVEIVDEKIVTWIKIDLLMHELIQKGEKSIVFKMKAGVIICIRFISSLIHTALEMRECGGIVSIICGDENQEEILRTMKLDVLLPIYSNEATFRNDLNICRATILCVDDEESALNALKRTLFDQPYRVLTALTGEEAINKAREELPDMALVDIMMPGMAGFDVVKMLRRLRPDMKIIMVTAFDDEKMLLLSATMHCDGFIEKPWEPSWLKSEIESILARRDHALL